MQPPARSEFPAGRPGDALWGQARHVWFKENRKPRQKPEPQIIEREVVRTEYVEVEKIVEVRVPVEAEGSNIDFDPLGEFIANERKEGETDELTLSRLREEIVDLLALQRDSGLAPAEEARLRYLTGHIKLMGD